MQQDPLGPPKDMPRDPVPPEYSGGQFEGPPHRGFGPGHPGRPDFGGPPGQPEFRDPARGEPEPPWRDGPWPGHRGDRQVSVWATQVLKRGSTWQSCMF